MIDRANHHIWHDGEYEGDRYGCNPNVAETQETALQRCREVLDEDYCNYVVDIIGGDVTTDRVREVVAHANAGGHMFHGIKRQKNMDGVIEKGVRTMTPEGWRPGSCSNWTSGRNLFGGGEKNMCSQGSGFFDYAHSYYEGRDRSFMNMAITNRWALKNILQEDVLFEPDRSNIELYFDVPREAMHLIRTKILHPSVPKNRYDLSRQFGQRAEQVMFELLEKAMLEGYEPGGETFAQLAVREIEPVKKPLWDIYKG